MTNSIRTELFRHKWLLSIACCSLFVLALCRYWVHYPTFSVPHDAESFCLAYNLYEKGSFANPFAVLATGPSAHLSPLFPAFLAFLMKIFGHQSAGLYAIELAAALVASLQLALFPVFSRMLGMGDLNGIIAAIFWIIAKVGISLGFEGFYAGILLACACCCYRRYLDSVTQGPDRLGWLLGALMGSLILLSPTTAPVFATWMAWEIWRRKSAFFKRSLIPLVVFPALILTPWTVRNYIVFHRFIFIRDNLGLELNVSNNDCAGFGQSQNDISGCFSQFHPNVSVNEAEKVLRLGEANYNDLQLREALNWIRSHPARFLQLSAMRFIVFWIPNESGKIFFWMPNEAANIRPDASTAPVVVDAGTGPPTDRRIWERFFVYGMTLLSAGGLVILYRRDPKSMAVLLSCLIVFPIVYYIVQFDGKYRYPIMWITFLLGALPITTIAQRLPFPGRSHPRR